MPSKPNILIVGQSGSGKTTSFEKLLTGPRAHDVAFVNFERKALPFLCDVTKLGFYAEPKDIFTADQALKDSYKPDHVKIIIYDSLTKYLEYAYKWARDTKTGWDVFNVFNDKISQFLEFIKETGKVTITVMHDEVIQIDTPEGGKVSRVRASVGQGKKWEGKVEKEFLIVFFTMARKKGQDINHVFQVNTDGLNSAKTPQWLGLKGEVPNDINQLLDKFYEKGVV